MKSNSLFSIAISLFLSPSLSSFFFLLSHAPRRRRSNGRPRRDGHQDVRRGERDFPFFFCFFYRFPPSLNLDLNLDLLKKKNSKLQAALAPVSLSIANESHLHAGHSGNPSGSPDAETHFRVEAVSEAFEGKNPVARHRLVYGALGNELKEGLHALALKTKTPREAQAAAEAKEAAK